MWPNEICTQPVGKPSTKSIILSPQTWPACDCVCVREEEYHHRGELERNVGRSGEWERGSGGEGWGGRRGRGN